MVALTSTKYDLRLFEVINSWDALCITGDDVSGIQAVQSELDESHDGK